LQVYADARLQVNYAVGAQVLLADNGELLANIRLCWRKANAAMKVAQFAFAYYSQGTRLGRPLELSLGSTFSPTENEFAGRT
jgi:hypothetical protein